MNPDPKERMDPTGPDPQSLLKHQTSGIGILWSRHCTSRPRFVLRHADNRVLH